MAKFNERLRELRLKKNISLEKMAKDLGTTKATLSRYENGLRDPKTEVTKKFAEYFGVSVDYLIGNTDKPNIELIDSGLPQELMFQFLIGTIITRNLSSSFNFLWWFQFLIGTIITILKLL